MRYDINIIVNGNRCKQYAHEGKTYIEAKKDSEYAIEIKNNSWEKILTVISVDGLNIIDGETAEPNGSGYVIDKYTSQKFFGFQYSSEKVAKFTFGDLGTGYASSKKDGSEKNSGIIGVRIWNEVPKTSPVPTIKPYYVDHMHHHYYYDLNITGAIAGNASPTTTPNVTWTTCNSNVTNKMLLNESPNGEVLRGYSPSNTVSDSKLITSANYLTQTDQINQYSCDNAVSIGNVESIKKSFDMETKWGESKVFKTKEEEFEKKELIHSFDIYYASRESLIKMGIDLGTEKKVNFPKSFKENKFAKPPKDWKE